MTTRPDVTVVRTERLLLRQFRDEDRDDFAAMNADPRVMEHFVRPQTREETDAFVDRIQAHWADLGWGLWALESLESGEFLGYTGLWTVRFDAPFRPLVEVGWRLAREHWGHGYASEAGRASLDVAFGPLGWDEVVSFTAVTNERSQAVMRRIGMVREPEGDFEHPNVPVGHPIRPHVLYRVTRAMRVGPRT